MRPRPKLPFLGTSALAIFCLAAAFGDPGLATPGGKTFDIATAGKAYQSNCASCHGKGLTGGSFGPSLNDAAFKAQWTEQGRPALRDFIMKAMPPSAPDSLPPEVYDQIAAFVADANGIGAAENPASVDGRRPMPPHR